MEFQEWISLLFGLVSGCLSFFVRRLIRELDELKADCRQAQRERAAETARVRDTYVKYEDFVRLQSSIDAKLSQIYELLSGRAQ